jgi:L-ascorbate metabolism protein UlaG (beta-lactamase superfamily)
LPRQRRPCAALPGPIDGDTIENDRQRIGIHGIDAPEEISGRERVAGIHLVSENLKLAETPPSNPSPTRQRNPFPSRSLCRAAASAYFPTAPLEARRLMRRTLLSLSAIFSMMAGPVLAQEVTEGRPPSHCIAFVENTPGVELIRAAATDWERTVDYRSAVPPEAVRISYIDHAMFLIQTPGGLSVVTDYNGFVGRSDFVPDVVTMNHAHGTHWTAAPDPRIPHVLRGWNPDGEGPAAHHLDLGEMLVRNVPTDIRGQFGGPAEAHGNSIFVFEVEGLCIGHLGHLHHIPTPEQYAAIGRLDVVMAPVDGGLTLPLPEMIALLKHVRSAIVIPMHWFSIGSLQDFLTGMEGQFRVDIRDQPFIDVSLRGLPRQPTIKVMPPRLLGIEAR